MIKVIVYMDDAACARQILEPLCARAAAGQTHWILVACAPRMTHRISKWVSHSARESWRAKWADKLFAQVQPWLQAHGAQVSTVLATGPLPDLLAQLQAEHGADSQLVDARRPKQEPAQEPAQEHAAPAPTAEAAAPAPAITRKTPRRWSLPGTLAGLGVACLLLVTD